MSSKTWRRVVLLLAVVVTGMVACVAVAQTATATVPPLVKVNGTLANAQGIVGVTFALYAEQTGGAPLWLETQNVTPDANGRYTVYLGANHANGVPLNLFASGEARWLGVQPEGQAEQTRAQLVSVPYALTAGDAQTLGGQPLSAFVLASAANGSTTTSGGTTASAGSGGIVALATPQTGSTAVTTNSGTTGYLAKFTSTPGDIENSLVYDTGTAVGIGTTNPDARLTVNANAAALTPIANATLHFANGDGSPSVVGIDSFGAINTITFRRADGTGAVPTALQNGEVIGQYGWLGRGATAYQTGAAAQIAAGAAETWTDSTGAGYLAFKTRPSGTTGAPTERMRIISTGYVGIGTTTPNATLEVNGNIKITKNSGGSLIFQDGTTQSTAGSVTGITAASGSGLTVTSGTSTPVIGTDPTVLQMRINAACGPGAYMTSVNSAGGINCSGVVSNPGTVTNVSAVSGSGLTVANATSTPQINTDFTVLQKRVAAGCPAGQFLQSIAVDGTPSCLPVYSAVPSGFTTLGTSPVPLAGYSVSGSVAINGRNPWSQTRSLNTARYGHGVASIGSSIFAVGGMVSAATSALWNRYNTSA